MKTPDEFQEENRRLNENINEQITILEPSKETASLLRDKNIFQKYIDEFDKQIEKEEKSKEAIFLSCSSIFVDNLEIPINSLVSSESSAGKSFVCKRIIKIFPRHLYEWRSKISGEAFTYWHVNENDFTWNGKICYLEDISQSVLDSSTFKVMASEGSVATVVRNQKAVDLFVNGTPCMLITTAQTNPSTEVLNRFQIISLDETTPQTEAIARRQAKGKKIEPYNPIFTNALKFINRVSVYVPFGELIFQYLKENYGFEDLRMRRDFPRFLDLIKCSCALHQWQREKNEDGQFIATFQDYDIARKVINSIQTTTLKGLTHKLKKAFDCCLVEIEFTAKDIHAKHPIVSMKMWYNYLDELCERGLLKTKLIENDESKKRITIFSVSKGKTFNLPDSIDLGINSTINTNVTNVTINTNVTNDNEQLKQLKQFTWKSPTQNNEQLKQLKKTYEIDFNPKETFK